MALGRVSAALAAGGLLIVAGLGATYAMADRSDGWHRGFGMHGGGHAMNGGFGMHRGGWRHGGGHGPLGGEVMEMLTGIDANDDGEITTDEIDALGERLIEKFDGNGDGAVEQAEIQAFVLARIEARINRRTTVAFRRFDDNGDGRITKAELSKIARKRFSWHDVNDDGKLSGDELPHRLMGMLRHWRGQGGAGDAPESVEPK